MSDGSDFASLTAAMVRRAHAPALHAADDHDVEEVTPSPSWHADVRLFAITWAAGFVFFLTFIA